MLSYIMVVTTDDQNMSLQEQEQEINEGRTVPSSRTGNTGFRLE